MRSNAWRTQRRAVSVIAGIALLALLALGGGVAAQAAPAVQVRDDSPFGPILTDAEGRTLYMFTRDAPGVSNCYEQCATNWPPLMTSGAPAAPDGLDGMLGTTTRKDGTVQVTYNQMPLYYWFRDSAPGDTNGQNVGGVWFVVNPAPAPAVALRQDEKLGSILTGTKGMTLYMYTRDALGISNCYDQCAVNWPPLLADGDPSAPSGLQGAIGKTQRKDGSWQVTYNGMPLYYWIRDQKPGDTTGQNVGGVWFVLNPADAPSVNVRPDTELGSILTDARGMSLYMFTRDEPGVSNCYDQCATSWPPLIVSGDTTGPDALAAGLGATERKDGSRQATYNGMPLYFWARDQKPGDTTGQNVGGVWFVVNP